MDTVLLRESFKRKSISIQAKQIIPQQRLVRSSIAHRNDFSRWWQSALHQSASFCELDYPKKPPNWVEPASSDECILPNQIDLIIGMDINFGMKTADWALPS
jgi:hypothetical protein